MHFKNKTQGKMKTHTTEKNKKVFTTHYNTLRYDCNNFKNKKKILK